MRKKIIFFCPHCDKAITIYFSGGGIMGSKGKGENSKGDRASGKKVGGGKERKQGLSPPPAKPSKKFIPPTPQEVTNYAASIDFDLEGEEFCDFYESKGWMIGKNKMRKWKQAVHTWRARQAKDDKKRRHDEDEPEPQDGEDIKREVMGGSLK